MASFISTIKKKLGILRAPKQTKKSTAEHNKKIREMHATSLYNEKKRKQKERDAWLVEMQKEKRNKITTDKELKDKYKNAKFFGN